MNELVSRRAFLKTAVLGSAALAVKTRLCAQPAKLPRKPNLLVFLPDQLRADTIAGGGASAVHGPNLHKLASQSVVFERAYVTQPICAPSRSSLLSGTWPHQTGCNNNKAVLSRKYRCLPEMLDDSDYRTGYFGKWHLGDEFSAQRGFQEWTSTEEYSKSALGDQKITGLSDYSKFLMSKGYKPDPGKGQTFNPTFVSTLPFELSKPKFLETRACEFLQRHRDEPFVVFVAFYEPHPPYNGPFNSEHSLEAMSLDASVDDMFGSDMPLRYRVLQERYKKRVKTTAKYREIKQKYFGLITEIDQSVGAILAKLADLGLSDRTITVLTSDHGDMMSGHGLLGKQVMFEQSARVPYLVRMPGQRPVSCSQPISHIDFLPTMLELMAKPFHPQCVGQSRANLIRGENSAPGLVFLEWSRSPSKRKLKARSKLATQEEIERAFFESTRAVVSPDGWKLCLRDQDKNELYNLHEDVEERHNLYYGDVHREVITALTGEIHRWQERVQDSLKV